VLLVEYNVLVWVGFDPCIKLDLSGQWGYASPGLPCYLLFLDGFGYVLLGFFGYGDEVGKREEDKNCWWFLFLGNSR